MENNKLMWVLLFLAFFGCNSAITEDEKLLVNLMRTQPENFEHIFENPEKYDVQIIYTQINRDSNNVPSFRSFFYNVDDRYYYPASTVKMPAALMALEKLNELNIPGLDAKTPMLTDSTFSGQSYVKYDSSSANNLPSIAHYLKKIFLVSDNDAFNRIYEFLGQEDINNRIRVKGYNDSRIITRLAIFLSEEENRHTNPIRFVSGDSVIYAQQGKYHAGELHLKGSVLKGKGYMRNGKLVSEPFDFTKKNFIPLDEMHQMLRAVMFPKYTDEQLTFNLTKDDYRFVYQYMSQKPSETSYPKYDTAEYYDAYSKLLMYGNDRTPTPNSIRIFNKYGQSYGYLIDHAYIMDIDKNIEFMLSAVIQTNENEIYNDNVYEYDEIAYPFMKNLGQLIYNHELQRERIFTPNLSRFMVAYDQVVQTSESFHKNLFQNYEHYHIPELNFQRINRSDIEPFLEELKTTPGFEVTKLGESVEGRDINMVKLGTGPTKVLLWSQMHGNESTATRALFEIFKFFASNDALDPYKEKILEESTLYFIPMLNPDGAEKFERRNALSIDLNRDALRLTSPEAQILKETRDKYEPEFGFNLHDQSKHYNVYRTDKTASISFLAPAYNYEKDLNDSRKAAMKLIVSMNEVLQQYIPGNVGRYDDAFEPRAFGDNIQKWGTNTILIESGGYPNDPEKRKLVKMNFIAILHGLNEIARGGHTDESVEDYFKIPDNDRKFFDLLIRNGKVERNGELYTMDIGIFNNEKDSETGNIYYLGNISELGDLSNYYGYEELDAEGMTISTGEVYPEILQNVNSLTPEKTRDWLRKGYSSVRVREMPSAEVRSSLLINIVPAEQKELPDADLGGKANLIISKEGKVINAIINGEIIDIQPGEKLKETREEESK